MVDRLTDRLPHALICQRAAGGLVHRERAFVGRLPEHDLETAVCFDLLGEVGVEPRDDVDLAGQCRVQGSLRFGDVVEHHFCRGCRFAPVRVIADERDRVALAPRVEQERAGAVGGGGVLDGVALLEDQPGTTGQVPQQA